MTLLKSTINAVILTLGFLIGEQFYGSFAAGFIIAIISRMFAEFVTIFVENFVKHFKQN